MHSAVRVLATALALLLFTTSVWSQVDVAVQGSEERTTLLLRPAQLDIEKASMADALRALAEASGVPMAFSPSILGRSGLVSCFCRQRTVAEALDRILQGTSFTYTEQTNLVVIIPPLNRSIERVAPRLASQIGLGLLAKVRAYAQGELGSVLGAVQGTVRSESGAPLSTAVVVVAGTNLRSITSNDGRYIIADVPPGTHTIRVSLIGYATREQEVAVVSGETATADFDLPIDAVALDQLVVTGYGTQEKVNLTGAVGVARSERLQNRSIANAGEGLQGVIPNLNITVQNGDPAQSPSFNVRGFESISGGSPLILVDGVPMDINRMNPNDIQSISVLKDASAAAVYGARGAYGVILVESKSGRQSDKVNISLNTQWSLAKPIFNMDVVTDPFEFVSAYNQASMRTNGTHTYNDAYVEGVKAWSENPGQAPEWGVVDGVIQFYGYNDYQNQLMTDFAPTQQHDLSISGGSPDWNHYFSLAHLNKDGYLSTNNENFKRNNLRLEVEFQATDWLSLNETVAFNSAHSDKPHFYNWDANINSLARVNPVRPIQFPDLEYYLEPGDRELYEQHIGMYFGGTNFFPYLLDGGRTTFTNNDLWLTQGVTLTPLRNLTIRSDFSFNNFSGDYRDVASQVDIVSFDLTDPSPISNGFSGDDWIDEQSNSNQYYVVNAYAEYIFDRFADHHIKAMAGYNQEWGKNKFVRSQARSLITPDITDINATVGPQQTFGGSSEVAMRGAFYRLNYIYRDKYLIEASGRYDGTSRFPKEDRFGFFPSASVGWRISNEGFMAGTRRILDHLQIRASYGTLGNQLLVDNNNNPIYYPYISTMGIGQSPYIMSDGQIPYVSAPGLVSPRLTWETVVSKNLGLDVALFGGKLGASFDVYTRETKDMLMDVSYPAILGTAAPQENAADLETSGWELELTWADAIGRDLHYDVTVALSDWKSEITKYDNPSGDLADWYVGQTVGDIWGFETAGIFQTDQEVADAPDQSNIGANWRPGDIRYADLDGDGQISFGDNTLDNPGDRMVIGNGTPRYNFGINTGISYKDLRLATFFQGVLQRHYWPSSDSWTWFFPFNAGHVEKYYITETWRDDHRDAYFPAPHLSFSDKKNVQVQSRYLQNAGYVRLKNITLSYDLPRGILDTADLTAAQIYLTGMNLWEYSPIHKPLDPETLQGGQGGYGGDGDGDGAIEYPMQRIFSLGARISF